MARSIGSPAPTLKPSIPHLASTGDSPSDHTDQTTTSDEVAAYLAKARAGLANAKAKRLPEEGADCSISEAHEVPTAEKRVDSDSGSDDEANSGYDSDGHSSEATVSSEADSSDGDGDSAVAEASGSKRPRSATTLPKKKTTKKEKKNQIAAADLDEDQVKTVEEELVLQKQPNWSLEKRAERAAATIRSTRKELRKRRHSALAKDATSRVAMQQASKILSSSQWLTVAGLSGAAWVKKWRKLQAASIEDKLSNTTSGRGWLYSVLASKNRLKAIGGSMIGVERATRYGKELHKLQQLDEALAALKKHDSQYDAWCVAPSAPCPVHGPHSAARTAHADGPRRADACWTGRPSTSSARSPGTRWSSTLRSGVAGRKARRCGSSCTRPLASMASDCTWRSSSAAVPRASRTTCTAGAWGSRTGQKDSLLAPDSKPLPNAGSTHASSSRSPTSSPSSSTPKG